MIALVTLCVLLTPTPSEVEAFFPLDKGRTWVYDDTGLPGEGYKDTVGNEQEVAGKTAIPIITSKDGKVDGSTFYRIEGDEVLVVAFEQNNPLPAPYPILKYGQGKNSWTYSGTTQWYGSSAPITIKGATKKLGSKDLFGEKRDTIQVTLDAVIGAAEGVSMKMHQVMVYARGIGLVEQTDTVTMNKTKTERRRKLLSFTPGSEG